MNDNTEQSVTDEPRGTAAGGHAVIINVPGCPLMVRAVDYNTLRAQLADVQRELVAKEAGRAGLELERNNAQRQHTMQCAINKADSQRILELTSRLAEAQKNEKRYLWMRDKETSEGWDIIGRSGTPDQIDAAIDAAMGEKNGT